jgi:hypothetical protein
VVALLVIASSSAAQAEEARRVPVVLVATESEAQALQAVLSELLGGLGTTMETSRVEELDVGAALRRDDQALEAVARVWIDLSADDEATLLLADGQLERVLIRRVTRVDRSDELVREELGLIVVTAVETLLAGTAVGAPREEVRAELGLEPDAEPSPPPEPAPAPDPAPAPVPEAPATPVPEPAAKPGREWRVGGAMFYEAQGYAAEEVIVHGPGLSIELDGPKLPLAPGLSFGAQYRIPFERVGEDAGFRLQSLALRLHAYIHLLRQEQFLLRLYGGGAAEILFLEPFLVEGREATLQASRTRVGPMARVALSTQLRLFGDTSLRVDLAADIDIVGTRYVIQRGEELIPLVEPLRVRPSLSIGLATSFAGATLFPRTDLPQP